jgi:hypothetical protein
MQMRYKGQFISLWRSLRDLRSPKDDKAQARASPALVFTAIVLASLFAILALDAHRGELESLSLLASNHPLEGLFLSP